MIKLQNKPNTNAPSAAFPYGDLRDNPGDNTGTPVNRELLSDIMQTVEKIVDESGITPNGLLDNASNGWQLYDAMKALFAKPNEFTATAYVTGGLFAYTSIFDNSLGTPTYSVTADIVSLTFSSLISVPVNDVDISVEVRSIVGQNPAACSADVQYNPIVGGVAFAVLSSTGTKLSDFSARISIRKK